jgi:hypothetical protein
MEDKELSRIANITLKKTLPLRQVQCPDKLTTKAEHIYKSRGQNHILSPFQQAADSLYICSLSRQ